MIEILPCAVKMMYKMFSVDSHICFTRLRLRVFKPLLWSYIIQITEYVQRIDSGKVPNIWCTGTYRSASDKENIFS